MISAIVNSFCTIAGSETPGSDSATINTLAGGNVDVSVITKNYPVVCNKAASATLTSQNGGLSGPAAASGFENIINYTASAAGFVAIATGSTATVPGVGSPEALGTANTGGAAAAGITVTITPLANSNPLVAGSYSDTLRLTISPL